MMDDDKRAHVLTTCAICGYFEDSSWHFSMHISSKHGIKIDEYVVKFLHDGVWPTCPECGCVPRFVRGDRVFKTYCKEHSYIAESSGGKSGGKKKSTWNKGKTKETDERLKKFSKKVSGPGNIFYGKQHTEEAKQSNADSHRLSLEEVTRRVNSRPDEFICLTPTSEYKFRQGQKLLFKCVVCEAFGRNTIVKHTLCNFERNPQCKVCHPGGSKEQLQIMRFIQSLGFETVYNDREAIAPKELDIYVPAKRFAIEYDSFYYHSYVDTNAGEDDGKRKDRHHYKTKLAEDAGVSLMHIFQDEWRDKSNIIKSMITHRLGATKRRIYARDCDVRVISASKATEFFEANHIAGNVNAGVAKLGLFLGDELVSAMTFRKPFHKNAYPGKAEMARFASTLDTVVIGGLQKLLKASVSHCKDKGYDGIVTYADLRYGQGKSYENAGFAFAGWTGLSFDWNDGVNRYPRFKYRADSRNGLTEEMVAQQAGVRRIYGCGNNRYILSF